MVLCPEPPPKLKIPGSKITELTDDANHDSPKIERRTRGHHIERHKSCVVTLSDMELNDFQPRRLLQTLETSKSPGGGSHCSLHEETPTDTNPLHRHAIADAALEALKRSIVYFRGQPIGTVAALDKSQGAALNYDQVFMRDFIPSALAFLMKGEHLIVKNFLVETAHLQSREKMVDLFKLGQGVMPASFKVHHHNPTQKTESLLADFGETAIGKVAPVDSGLWWIILLRAYTKWTGDNSLAESPNCQRAMHLILRLCLSEGCDASPALLCADGCSMIDRRMGIYGYPIEIQALFFMAMRCALTMLKQDSDAGFVNHITKRIQALSYHLHSYYWRDFQRLKDIYRYKTEEYSQTALNKFSVIPESIPDWIFDFMPSRGGYFTGNVSPARMDFRWFCLGNFIAILSSLATGEQAEAILDLVEERWEELVGEMSLKICYPAMENQEWQIVTGCSMIHRSTVFMRDFIPSALAFLMKGEHLIVKNFLVETARLQSREKMVDFFKLGQGVMPASFKVHHFSNATQEAGISLAGIGRVARVVSSSLSKWIRSSYLVDSTIFEWATCGLFFLTLKMCNVDFDTISALFGAGGCSNMDIINLVEECLVLPVLPAWVGAADKYSMLDNRMVKSIDESGFDNTAIIYLDGLEEFIRSYLMGIGRLRWWCETYGMRAELPNFYNANVVVFTTPPGGTFKFIIKHEERSITVSLYGRNLYTMGFKGPFGTFELKAKNEKRRNYMSGEVTILPFKKNYRFLAPQMDVRQIKLGLFALIQAFEVLHKCVGEEKGVSQAVGAFAVHLCEAGRLQSVLKDVCGISLENSIETLDSRSTNSFWIEYYDSYGGQEMKRISYLKEGETLPPIKQHHIGAVERKDVTELEILNEIRIFPRDGHDEGFFKHEPKPSEATENDPVLEPYLSWLKSRGMKPPERLQDKGGLESTATLPSFLLEDWNLGEEDEGMNEKDEPISESKDKKQSLADENEHDGKMAKFKEKGEGYEDIETQFEGFLNHFSAVRRVLKDLNTEDWNQLKFPSIERTRYPSMTVSHASFPSTQEHVGMKESIFKFPRMKLELGTIGRKLLKKPSRPIHPNLLIRAAHIIGRFRFVI